MRISLRMISRKRSVPDPFAATHCVNAQEVALSRVDRRYGWNCGCPGPVRHGGCDHADPIGLTIALGAEMREQRGGDSHCRYDCSGRRRHQVLPTIVIRGAHWLSLGSNRFPRYVSGRNKFRCARLHAHVAPWLGGLRKIIVRKSPDSNLGRSLRGSETASIRHRKK
jgi:hypothetical protein